MYVSQLKEFLKYYDCKNIELFDLILETKKQLKNDLYIKYNQDVFIEPIKLETSIKNLNSGEKIKGRYVIGIDLREFKLYTLENKQKIFKILGFEFENFNNILENIKEECQLYVGFENKKGKLYFDRQKYPDIGMGFESTGKVKYYKLDKDGTIKISTEKNGDPVCTQKRIIDSNKKYWYSITKDYETYYYRPNIYIDQVELKKYSVNIQKEYKVLKDWYNHECRYCSKSS